MAERARAFPDNAAGFFFVDHSCIDCFTGDHLWWSPVRRMLSASRSVDWYSWDEQLRSLEKLLDHDFRWVLPGHGRTFRADSPAAMRRELERGLRRLRAA
jgi:glyoxylase-like metal-dependent hydrolase (beta-lactamase superfamily II)